MIFGHQMGHPSYTKKKSKKWNQTNGTSTCQKINFHDIRDGFEQKSRE
jgi:hypothetical protein